MFLFFVFCFLIFDFAFVSNPHIIMSIKYLHFTSSCLQSSVLLTSPYPPDIITSRSSSSIEHHHFTSISVYLISSPHPSAAHPAVSEWCREECVSTLCVLCATDPQPLEGAQWGQNGPADERRETPFGRRGEKQLAVEKLRMEVSENECVEIEFLFFVIYFSFYIWYEKLR